MIEYIRISQHSIIFHVNITCYIDIIILDNPLKIYLQKAGTASNTDTINHIWGI